jgi:hypothetical protein
MRVPRTAVDTETKFNLMTYNDGALSSTSTLPSQFPINPRSSLTQSMAPFDWRRLRSSLLIRPFVPNNLLSVLRLGWVILVIWGEIGVFLYTLSFCRWPGLAHHTVSSPYCTLSRVSE